MTAESRNTQHIIDSAVQAIGPAHEAGAYAFFAEFRKACMAATSYYYYRTPKTTVPFSSRLDDWGVKFGSYECRLIQIAMNAIERAHKARACLEEYGHKRFTIIVRRAKRNEVARDAARIEAANNLPANFGRLKP